MLFFFLQQEVKEMQLVSHRALPQVLVKVAQCRLEGNDKGGVVLDLGDGQVKGHFARSVLTSGIVRLFEGETISHPVSAGEDPKKQVCQQE